MLILLPFFPKLVVNIGAGAYRYVGRRGSALSMKDVDGSLNFSHGKPSMRGVSTYYGSNEVSCTWIFF